MHVCTKFTVSGDEHTQIICAPWQLWDWNSDQALLVDSKWPLLSKKHQPVGAINANTLRYRDHSSKTGMAFVRCTTSIPHKVGIPVSCNKYIIQDLKALEWRVPSAQTSSHTLSGVTAQGFITFIDMQAKGNSVLTQLTSSSSLSVRCNACCCYLHVQDHT